MEHIISKSIKKEQLEKLKQAIEYVYSNSVFYKKLIDESDFSISDKFSLENFRKIPFTVKDDIQASPEDFYCVGRDKIVDYSTTSGTMGRPLVYPLTEKDLDRLAYNESQALAITGATSADVFQLTTTLDKHFMAGLAYFLGVRKLGATIIRTGPGVLSTQWENIINLKPTFLIAVPSFLLRMIDYAKKNNIDYKNSSVKAVVCIGEAIRNQKLEDNILADRIKKQWDIDLFSTYASTEMATAFTECSNHKGGHLQEDLLVAEVLDNTNNEVEEGELGELVVTTLGVEGMPVLRYRTGDMVRPYFEKCSCGRNSMRLGPVEGRKQQMIKLKGTTIYPNSIINVLTDIEEVKDFIIVLRKDINGLDEVLLKLNCDENQLVNIKAKIKEKLRVSPVFQILTKEVLIREKYPEKNRKPISVLDLRV